MYQKIFLISHYAEDVASGVLLLVSLLLGFRKENVAYMKSFPIYAIGNGVATILSTHPGSGRAVNMWFTLFELVYFSYFLSRVIASRRMRWLLYALNAVYGVLFALERWLHFSSPETVYFTLGESFILIIFCGVYFMEEMARPRITGLTREPAFWMVSGIFFYFLMLIPTLAFVTWYYYEQRIDVMRFVYSLNNYSLLISYSLFTIALLCSRQKLS